MRKYLRDQIIEIIATIAEGIDYAKKSETNSAKIILSDCVLAIDVISNTIKENMTVERHDKYKTILGKISILINKFNQYIQNDENSTTLLQEIKINLNSLRNKLLTDPEIKLEIVFLPYNANMWDSMESIWREAKEDVRCNCYVIPIPYYERNPDLSLGKQHYDGGLFPKNVPIIDYNNYDIKIRKPDIIYIHNPYDGNNYVTSIDPSYYSYELKKYTDTLIYVPYYVTNGTIPENHVWSSAISVVDKVIVQSEQIRNEYIKYIQSDKIIALGSPKIDRVLYFEKNKPEIPEEWKKIIGNKKVVLFNTSLSALLTHGTKVIDKIRYVFSCFENRKDVVLLWRPHPLSENTISSMRPNLLKEYYQLELEYKEKHIGIFDDSPDVERAIAVSDAYFGDSTSSLVHLYGITGKPIMIQDLDIIRQPNKEEINSMWFGSISDVEDGTAWLVNGNYNGISSVNFNTGKIEFIAEIPSEKKDGIYLYGNVLKYNNKLLLVPVNGKEIAEYDFNSGITKKIPLKNLDKPVVLKFLKAILYKNYVFITPFMYPAIIRYDITTGECKYYTEWYEKLLPYIHSFEEPIFANGVCVRENKLLMPFSQENIVLEFDMSTGDSIIHRVGRNENNYWSMAFDGRDYWLIQNNNNNNNNSIVRWNFETGDTKEYSNYPIGFINAQHNFNEIVYCENYLLAFPRHSNMIIKVDIDSGTLSEFDLNLGFVEGDRKSNYYNLKNNYYFARSINKDTIIAMSMYDNSLIKINTKTEDITKIKVELEKNDIDSYISFNNYFETAVSISDYHYIESKYLTLYKLLDYITTDKNTINQYQIDTYSYIFENADGTSGQKIHQHIINEYLYN